MNSKQALDLFAQIINQTKFLPQEYEAVKQAFQIINQLVEEDMSPVKEENGNKTK